MVRHSLYSIFRIFSVVSSGGETQKFFARARAPRGPLPNGLLVYSIKIRLYCTIFGFTKRAGRSIFA